MNQLHDPRASGAFPGLADDVAAYGDSPGLLELLTWVGEGKRLVAIVTLLATVIALAVAFLLPVKYASRTSLLPPSSQQSGAAAAALAALGTLGGLAGATSKSPDELYTNLLASDSVLRALDGRFKLRDRYERDSFEQLRSHMEGIVTVGADKKAGVIFVELLDKDAKFAATLANAYAEELTKLLSRLAVTEAQQRRAFFERQLGLAKTNLMQADESFQKLQEKSGVVVLDKQAEGLMLEIGKLRAAIGEIEVRLKVSRNFATAENPEVARLNLELTALRSQLARAESVGVTNGVPSAIGAGNIPAVTGDYVRARREVKIQEALLEGLLRQYELARLDEAKEGPSLQVIDVAVPAERKASPKRLFIVAGAALGGLMLGLLIASVMRYVRWSKHNDPQRLPAWLRMQSAWRLK